jgi:hypothetical protein
MMVDRIYLWAVETAVIVGMGVAAVVDAMFVPELKDHWKVTE